MRPSGDQQVDPSGGRSPRGPSLSATPPGRVGEGGGEGGYRPLDKPEVINPWKGELEDNFSRFLGLTTAFLGGGGKNGPLGGVGSLAPPPFLAIFS